MRIICVDDHGLLLDGLKAHFSIDGSIDVVSTLPTAERLIDVVREVKPDLVLIDIEMPGPDAFEVADRLLHEQPGVRVVFLSAHAREGYVASAYRCGASGYFSKSDDPKDISDGIRSIARSAKGEFLLGPRVRECCVLRTEAGTGGRHRGAAGDAAAPRTRLESLTPRELEVLRLIGKGLSRTEIARQLCRSAKTIDGHQERMLNKLGISSRSDLIRFAIREGLAEA